MSIRIQLALALLASPAALACGGGEENPATGDGSGGNGGAGGSATGGDGGGSDAGPEGGAATEVSRLSCGNVPVMSRDYRHKVAPPECVSASEASCCTQAEACAADAVCTAWTECQVACGLDRLCRGDCSVQTPTNEVTSALLDCQGALTECIDLSCMSEPLPTLDGATGTWTFKFVNFASTSVPLEGVRIRVCAMDDLQCASPLDETTTDATGEVTFDAPNGPGGMDAYLEATGAAIAPTLFVPRFGTIPSPLYVSWTGLDSPTLGALQGILGATENPDRGLVAVNIYSCGFRAPAGLHFASSGADGTTIQMYAASAIPSPAATMSDGNGTAGHFANHPVGRHVLSATVAATGEHYGSIDIVVRGGFFTAAEVPPSAP